MVPAVHSAVRLRCTLGIIQLANQNGTSFSYYSLFSSHSTPLHCVNQFYVFVQPSVAAEVSRPMLLLIMLRAKGQCSTTVWRHVYVWGALT